MVSPFGQTELIIALVVLFILFGHRLPSLMRLLGRPMADFQDRSHETPWLTAIDRMMIVVLMIVLFFSAIVALLMIP